MNIIISGLLWTGAPRQILDAADRERIFLFAGDGHLLRLKKFRGIPILTASGFLNEMQP